MKTRDETHRSRQTNTVRDPRALAAAFVLDRRPAQPDVSLAVLELVLPLDWTDFLAARWITHAAIQVYTAYVPGFSHRRTHQLLERFVTWLHAGRQVDDEQRDLLQGRIDEMRSAHIAP